MGWISIKDRLPEKGASVLIIVNGKPHNKIDLIGACEFGNYSVDEGWIVEEYLEWEEPTVTHWMPLPEPPKEETE